MALAPPDLSVVLVGFGDWSRLARTVRHLREQTVHDRIELLLAHPEGHPYQAPAEALQGFHSVRTLVADVASNPTLGRAAGALAASATVVAFTEDHCYPPPNWAAAIIAAHRGPHGSVGPLVRNGNPATLISWAAYLHTFARWAPGNAPGRVDQTPWHNTAYKRDALVALGDRLVPLLTVEGLLQAELAHQGQDALMIAGADLDHVNFSRLPPLVVHGFLGGRLFGASRAKAEGWGPLQRLLRAFAWPLVPPLRLRRLWQTSRILTQPHPAFPRLVPLLLLALTAHAFGEAVGCLTGSGGMTAAYGTYEMLRQDQVTPAERAWMLEA